MFCLKNCKLHLKHLKRKENHTPETTALILRWENKRAKRWQDLYSGQNHWSWKAPSRSNSYGLWPVWKFCFQFAQNVDAKWLQKEDTNRTPSLLQIKVSRL